MQTKTKMTYKKSAATKERIFNAAMKLMSEIGYQGTTIRGICTKAHVSPATFYCYYNNKSDLLQEFYNVSDAFFRDEIPKLIKGLSFVEQMRMYVREYALLNIETGLDMMRVLYNPANDWFAVERPMQHSLFDIICNGKLEGVISEQMDSHYLVKSIFILLRGVCYDWCVCCGVYNLEQTMVEQIDFLLNGICIKQN